MYPFNNILGGVLRPSSRGEGIFRVFLAPFRQGSDSLRGLDSETGLGASLFYAACARITRRRLQRPCVGRAQSYRDTGSAGGGPRLPGLAPQAAAAATD